MLTIGIDPGTAATGYGIIQEDEKGNLETIDYGVIHTSNEQSLPYRLLEIHNRLLELIQLHRPQSGAVEKLFFQKNVRTAISVGQGRGIAMLALAQAGIEVAEYTPLEVKLAVTGYGGADKRQIQEMVKVLLGMEEIPKPDDAADALAVTICHIHSYRTRKLLMETELKE